MHPVDHVAAVAGAGGDDAVAVHPGVLVQGGGQALVQILEGTVAPVAADGVGELLAVAGRAVEVDGHGGEAGADVGLGIPAVVEVVAEAALGAAVHQEGHGPLLPGGGLGFGPVVGLDHVGVDRLVVPAGEGELLGLAHQAGGQLVAVEVGDLLQVLAVGLDGVELGGRLQILHAEQQARRSSRLRLLLRPILCTSVTLPMSTSILKIERWPR